MLHLWVRLNAAKVFSSMIVCATWNVKTVDSKYDVLVPVGCIT